MSKYKLSDITWVSIETTNICNMTCDYCPKSLDELNHRKIGVDVLSKDVFLKIIDFLPNLPNLKYVSLTDFNEFFQTPDLTTFYLPELKKKNLPYWIGSNGSVKPKHIEYYADHPPKYLVLGVQTITETQFYMNNRLEKTSWGEYLNNLAEVIRFFYDNCAETLISVEVAINPTDNLFHKLTKSVENKYIPSESEQMKHLPKFLSELSTLTDIKFELGSLDKGRYDAQKVIAKTSDEKIIFGLKAFIDINDFYNNIPTDHDPVCYTDSLTFDAKGNVKMCCIDYRNSTEFSNVNQESMEGIFEKYLTYVDTMRSEGSPFEGCRNCKGFKSKSSKLFSLKRNYYPKIVKKIPSVRLLRNLLFK